MQGKKDYFEIDIFRLLKALLRRFWALILAMILFAGAGKYYAANYITPYYTATALMYVDSGKTMSISGVEVKVGGLGDSSLITPYLVILRTRITINAIIKAANLPYSYEAVRGMIGGYSVDGTAIFAITVTSSDPEEAKNIANTITEVLPQKIQDVLGSCSIQTVDYAVTPTSANSNSVPQYTKMGALVGFALAAGIIILIELTDDSIRSSEDLTGSYKLPVLAEIPDLNDKNASGSYKGYKKGYRKYKSYYKKNGYYQNGYAQQDAKKDAKKGGEKA